MAARAYGASCAGCITPGGFLQEIVCHRETVTLRELLVLEIRA